MPVYDKQHIKVKEFNSVVHTGFWSDKVPK